MPNWDGYFNPPDQTKNITSAVSILNSDSTGEQWQKCLEVIDTYDHYIYNEVEGKENLLFPSRRWTFLHHAAYHQAPLEVLKSILEKGYRLTLKDAEGKLPVDHANNETYKSLLQPKYIIDVNVGKINKIEKNFHAVIASRVADLVQKNNLILPVIGVLLEDGACNDGQSWFAVPGMYGGFTFEFEFNANKTDVLALVTSSWCRVAGGSGQRHKCTENKWTLEEEGFVLRTV